MIIEKCQANAVANRNTTQRNTTGSRQEQYTQQIATQRNTTGKRQEHNTQQIATQRNATQLEEHNMTKLKTEMQRTVELVDRPALRGVGRARRAGEAVVCRSSCSVLCWNEGK